MNILQKISLVLFLWLTILFPYTHLASAQTGMVIITDIGLIPNNMTLKKGEKVELIIQNQDDMVRSFVIPKLNVSSPLLMEGEMASVQFTPDQTGSFHFHANSPQFGNNRFTGVLTIIEK